MSEFKFLKLGKTSFLSSLFNYLVHTNLLKSFKLLKFHIGRLCISKVLQNTEELIMYPAILTPKVAFKNSCLKAIREPESLEH